jgi:hypothetical protein
VFCWSEGGRAGAESTLSPLVWLGGWGREEGIFVTD